MDINKSIEFFEKGTLINEIEVQEVNNLISEKPFLFHPYALLAKFYFSKNDYRFQETLTKASLRTQNREILYKYINSQSINHVFESKFDDSSELILSNNSNTVEDFLNSETVELKNNIEIGVETQTEELPFQIIETLTEIEEKNSLLENVNSESINVEIKEEYTVKPDVSDFLKEFENTAISKTEIVIETENISNEIDEIKKVDSPSNFYKFEEKEIEYDFTKIKEVSSPQNEFKIQEDNLKEVETHFSFVKNEHIEESINSVDLNENPDFFQWLNQIKNKPKQIIEPQKDISVSENETPIEKQFQTIIKPIEIDSILDKFINENPQIRRPKKEFFNAENMAKKSEDFETIMVSETLAKIYEQQGNISLAIKTYQKLILLNPEKTAFFAAQIENLKK